MVEIILASKSKVRGEILEKNGVQHIVIPSNVDEDPVKKKFTKWRRVSWNNFKKFGRVKSEQSEPKKLWRFSSWSR